ncbi:MAG: hypothetical protein IKG40_00590 [Bacilli bacterium]|nr:hypothetical protein [Bacilli bacterium]
MYLILISLAIFSIIPREKTMYSKFGGRTLQVYVLHFIIVLIVLYKPIFNVLSNLFGYHVYAVLITMGVITSSILSLKCFEKPFNKIMKYDFKRLYSNK